MLNKVLATIQKYKMLMVGDKVVIAVSGGPDSMALLCILNQLKEQLGISLHVVHINHMFRAEAVQEAEFVRNYVSGLGLPVTIFNENVPHLVQQTKSSKQAVAREVRYKCLSQVADQIGARVIATAHHANDQAETVLLHMLRGSGVAGLKGLLPVRDDKYIRPLFDVYRVEIEAYCEGNKLPFVTDQTNLSPVYLRNRVRNELLPLMEDMNPSIVTGLVRLSEIVRAEEEYITQQVDQITPKMVCWQQEIGWELDVDAFNGCSLAIKRRLIRWMLAQVRGKPEETDFSEIERVIDLAERKTSGQVLQLAGRITVRRSYNRMIFGNTEQEHVTAYSYKLKMPGVTRIPELGMQVEVSYNEHTPDTKLEGLSLDLDKTGEDIWIRPRRPGDRFHPEGLSGSKKIKDFLIDRKIERIERDKIPLFTIGDKVLAIGDLRVDRHFAVTDGTKRKFFLKLLKIK